MKEFFEEFKYHCSSANETSRGVYIMIAITLILCMVIFVSGIVAEVVFVMAGNFQVLPLALSGIFLVIFIALILWLKKS